MGLFPYLLLLALAGVFGWSGPQSIAFPLAMMLPFAYVIPFMEYKQRDQQKRASNDLICCAEKQTFCSDISATLVLAASLKQVFSGLLLFLVAYAGMTALCSLILAHRASGLIPLEVDWSVLYAIAALGAVLSLRIKRAYCVFVLCMLSMFLIKFI